VAFADGCQSWVGQDAAVAQGITSQRNSNGLVSGAAKGTIGGHSDVDALTKFDKPTVREVRMRLDLVNDRWNGCTGHQSLNLLGVAIGDAYRTCQAILDAVFEPAPNLLEANVIDNNLQTAITDFVNYSRTLYLRPFR